MFVFPLGNPQIKEDKLRNTFATKGDVTDIQLKFTKGGVFRKFAFIGFKSEVEAQNAVDFFNRSFLDSSRIEVRPRVYISPISLTESITNI